MSDKYDRLEQLIGGYDAGGLKHLYEANKKALEDYERNAKNMYRILKLMEAEMDRRGIDYDA